MSRKGVYIIILVVDLLVNGTLHAQRYFKVTRLPFNTPLTSEFSPVFYQDGLVFTSNRKNDLLVVYKDDNNQYLLDIFYTVRKKSGGWENPVSFDNSILTPLNEGPACFNSDYSQIYFTKNIASTTKIGDQVEIDSTYGIFTADKAGDSWVNVNPLPINSEVYNTGYPYLSPDNKTLYYCSNSPEGNGKYDIYSIDKQGDSWDEPVHLDDKINTPNNEVFPYMHPSGRLYFASDRPGGRGGLDIYYTEMIDGEWIPPVILPNPFNSRSDDFSIIINNTFDTGYFASNRQGSDDIFIFYSTLPTFSNCNPQVIDKYCYEFFEEGSVAVDTTSLRYEWDLGDGTKIRDLRANHCYAEPGDYTIQLNVIDTLTGEVYFNEATYFLPIEKTQQPFITCLDTVSASSQFTLDGRETYLKDFTIDEYYWDLGDGNLDAGVEANHSYKRPGQYLIRLGVTGYAPENKKKLLKECVVKTITVLENK